MTGPDRFEPLRSLGVEVDAGTRRLSEYSYDASNYHQRPAAVVFPRNVDDVVATVRFCADASLPVISRGGGTSMAGNAVGIGVVMDFSRHMNAVVSVNPNELTAVVEPGRVIGSLQEHVQQATDGRFTFAPDPSSKSRAALGGAVGNDACGNHSVRYGRTSDHVIALDVVTASGHRLTATDSGLRATDPNDDGAAREASRLEVELLGLASSYLSDFRLELGRIPRQVSGYHLSHLLPENGFNVARSLVGSEGTCAVVVAVTVRLVPVPRSTLLLTLGYSNVVDAARDVMTILEFHPAAIEGIDEAIVDTMRVRRGTDSVADLPEGKAWLYVELDGDTAEEVIAKSRELLERLAHNGRLLEGRPVPDAAERASLWRVREDGAGLSARLPSGEQSWPGWEDSAVAPENLADYLADFLKLLNTHQLTGILYGHFGAGCMHVRVTFDLRTDDGRAIMSAFVHEAAALVVRHGGSLSGEHGDGRSRSALLPLMYSPSVMNAFSAFKNIWDPTALLNPGSITAPQKVTDNLALQGVPDREWRTSFDIRPTGSSNLELDPFVDAVQGCVGIGKCRNETGGVMCPSYRATGDERDSTRGRARVLQDMVSGSRTVAQGWKSRDVRDVLDLCLSCKACSTDCPVGVDMATYKSEFFDHYYRHRLRPLSHYSLGWLPRWLAVIGHVTPLVNAVLGGPLGQIAARAAGLTTRRSLPRFAPANAWRKGLSTTSVAAADSSVSPAAGVVLLVDTFTKGFRPHVAGAAQRVLAGAGHRVECSADVCCGLTWISTGQLGIAKKVLAKAAETLDDGTDRPIIVIEPSCAAAFRKDLPELIHTPAAARVAARIRSFATAISELSAAGWTPQWPGGNPPSAVTVQTHCHEYSTFGAAVQKRALTAVGVESIREATGCCGVAGNFGFEAEHYDVSMAVADQALVPALAATRQDTPVLVDGFSCQMQVQQLDATRHTLHLAELLDPDSDEQ